MKTGVLTFTVRARVLLADGEPSGEDSVREEIRQHLDEADPGSVYPEDNEYEIVGWLVT